MARTDWGTPHNQSGDPTAAALRQAAVELVAARGFAPVTVGDIYERAGTTRATYYKRYASKDACILAAAEELTARCLARSSADSGRFQGPGHTGGEKKELPRSFAFP